MCYAPSDYNPLNLSILNLSIPYVVIFISSHRSPTFLNRSSNS